MAAQRGKQVESDESYKRKEFDFMLGPRGSGGPGEASGGSGRARGRLLRPPDGRDGRKGRYANLRGREGVNNKVRRFSSGNAALPERTLSCDV